MKSALLVLDAQNITIEPIPNLSMVLENIKKVTDFAREENIPVIFVKVAFRNTYPEVHNNNIIFSLVKANKLYQDSHADTDIHAEVIPQENDIIVYKKRISAFSGSDLEIILRSMRIETLVITGFWTSGVVLSTVREAFDKDYRLTVIEDCCGEPEVEIQDFLMHKIFPSQVKVLVAKDWIDSFEK